MAEEQNRTLQDKFMLRLPDGMRDRIKAAGDANNRSMNAEIVATLEEKYPAPVRHFNYDKLKEYQDYIEKRSKEIFASLDVILERYGDPSEKVESLRAEFDALMDEHKALWDYDIEDDRFHDIEQPSDD